MKLLSILGFTTTMILSSCSYQGMPISLKGTYAKRPIQITSDKDFSTVWDKLIDLFAQKGLPIKIIDRSSGLIVCDRTLLKTTVENKNGELEDNEAWIVVPKVHDPGTNRDVAITGTTSGVYSKKMIPRDASGEWNVRVKSENGTTVINVNIVNVKVEDYTSNGYSKNIPVESYQSTGVFEKVIIDAIK